MELYDISHEPGVGLKVHGLPEGTVKLVEISGPKETRLAHLALHIMDLDFATQCLMAINDTPIEQPLIREALWRSAVIHFVKCFVGGSRRSQLDENAIFGGDDTGFTIFRYFKNIRDKHYVHDENGITQVKIAAALNDGQKKYKVERVVVLSVSASLLAQENWSNLKLLIERSRDWVVQRHDQIAEKVSKELERCDFEDLDSKPAIVLSAPATDQVSERRQGP